MKIYLIRHADPDYENDCLTELGRKEASLLAERLKDARIDYIYVSTMGRAMETAKFTQKLRHQKAEAANWLREFDTKISRPDKGYQMGIAWDILPDYWTKEEDFFNVHTFPKANMMHDSFVPMHYRDVCDNLDRMLAKHGYVREGDYYRAMRANDDVIALFSHFGCGCVLLSHLLNISPTLLWHGFAAAPASLTEIVTEERRKGIASFRVNHYGDTAHLDAAGLERNPAGRFCEMFDNEDERHD